MCLPLEARAAAGLGCISLLALRNEYHRLGGLDKRFLFSRSSGGWKSKIKVSEGLVSARPLSWLEVASSLCVSVS